MARNPRAFLAREEGFQVRSPARRSRSRRLSSMLGTMCILGGLLPVVVPVPVLAVSSDLFISEYIEGSSNNKAIEIYNGTGAAVDLAAGGYNLQMYFNGSATAGLTINLTGSVADGDVYVVAQSAANATILAQADQTNGSGWFNGDDAVALRKGTAVLDVIGQIGFDPGAEWGSGLTSTADNTLRRKATIEAGDPDGSTAFDPSVEWDGFATDTIAGLGSHPDVSPFVSATSPGNGAAGVAVDANISISFSEPVDVTAASFTISCTTSSAHTTTASGGPTTFTLDPSGDFVNSETCTVSVIAAEVSDQDASDPPDHPFANHVFSFTTEAPLPPPTPIHVIQGAGHLSPLAGQTLNSVGTVTVKSGNGFWMQTPDADVDANDATSEAIFVFTSSAPTATVGDAVRVTGTIAEFRPGGSTSTNLTTTEITGPSITTLSSGNPLPAASVVGIGGRIAPMAVIEDDAIGSVETSGIFDPATDGIDFYESLEGMRLQINNAVVVGPTNGFGETWVVPDNGANASVRTSRGGIVVRPGDFNPERIQIDDTLAPLPLLNVGDAYGAAIVGVLDYNFGNFELLPTASPTGVDKGLAREVTAPITHPDVISIGTFNVENLDPGDPDAKFQQLASLIVHNLRSPDVLSLEEIQDSNGPTNDGTVDATLTLNELVAAIHSEGGPAYEFRQINPLNNQDGGEPGGNIRVGFLFRTDRGVAFVDRPGGDSTTPTTIVAGPNGPQLSASPGRIDPTNTAWASSRKPLAGEFTFNGHHFFAITNHFNSKSGDQPLFGRFQRPTLTSEVQRVQQAAIVNDFADDILAVDPQAEIVVLGDLNDFEFSPPVQTLVGDPPILKPLMETLLPEERYSYVFEGNSQSLDHIVVSDSLRALTQEYDVVHVNAEFAIQTSDHDPQVVKVALGCQFSTSGTTMTLLTDCITDDTIHIPNGWTLDGDGHTITGVDPADGHFLGAVVANAGVVAHVTDLTVTVDGLADVCDDGANRLRGILFDGAAGSITNSHAVDINQGPSGCQEGNGIEVRNAPFDTSGPDLAVTISGNVVTGYQKTGILANGSVVATILSNTVTGAGPIGYIAQNGVQVAFGGSGLVKANTISGNSYTGPDLACGILFFDADGVKQQANILFGNERDICNFGRGGGNSKPAK
jgi:predicted extracellular nuclease